MVAKLKILKKSNKKSIKNIFGAASGT